MALEVGSFAKYWRPGQDERTVLVTDVDERGATQARLYSIQDWDTGEQRKTFGCWLKPVKPDDVIIMDIMENNDFEQFVEIDQSAAAPSTSCQEPTPSTSTGATGRFPVLSDQDIDKLASSRTSANTDEPTLDFPR